MFRFIWLRCIGIHNNPDTLLMINPSSGLCTRYTRYLISAKPDNFRPKSDIACTKKTIAHNHGTALHLDFGQKQYKSRHYTQNWTSNLPNRGRAGHHSWWLLLPHLFHDAHWNVRLKLPDNFASLLFVNGPNITDDCFLSFVIFFVFVFALFHIFCLVFFGFVLVFFLVISYCFIVFCDFL